MHASNEPFKVQINSLQESDRESLEESDRSDPIWAFANFRVII